MNNYLLSAVISLACLLETTHTVRPQLSRKCSLLFFPRYISPCFVSDFSVFPVSTGTALFFFPSTYSFWGQLAKITEHFSNFRGADGASVEEVSSLVQKLKPISPSYTLTSHSHHMQISDSTIPNQVTTA